MALDLTGLPPTPAEVEAILEVVYLAMVAEALREFEEIVGKEWVISDDVDLYEDPYPVGEAVPCGAANWRRPAISAIPSLSQTGTRSLPRKRTTTWVYS